MINKKLKARKAVAFGAVAGLLMGAWSVSSHAQTCTITNWGGGAVNGDSLFAGSPQEGNARYAGPCSLAVSLDNDMAYVVDDSPIGEPAYIARFYFNPNGNASADKPMIVFAANEAGDGTGDDVLQVWYNVGAALPDFTPQANAITLLIQTDDGLAQINVTEGVRATGWNSVEIVWGSGAESDVVLNVNGINDVVVGGLNTSSQSIGSAALGLVGIPGGFSVISDDPLLFDDFDSRRQSRPGRLCRGLTDESRTELANIDVLAIFEEVASGGAELAGGVPDFNEDGVVDNVDLLGVFNQVSGGFGDCEFNS